METKKCTKCQQEKTIDNFWLDRSCPRSRCIPCELEIKKKSYLQNRDNALAKMKEYHQKHYPHRKEKQQEKARARAKTPEAREKLNKRLKERRDNDPAYRLKINLRRRCLAALKGSYKHKTTFALIGCSCEDLKRHLESLWREGMNWGNYGQWHVDHKVPLTSFNLADEEEQKKAFHFTNLQPLWAKDNLTKGNRL